MVMTYITASIMSLCAPLLQAAQEFRVKDGDTIKVKISSRELSRIAVTGEGRLDKVWGASGVLEIQPDKERGEIFIRTTGGAPAAFSFFVRDDSGATYTIVAQQYDIPAQTILLKSVALRKSMKRESTYLVTPLVELVKQLMKGMALGGSISGYVLEDLRETIPLWKEANIVLRRVYRGNDLIGEVYTIENRTDQVLKFHESEFMNFGGRTQAVALEYLSLQTDKTGFLYIVRNPSGGE